MRQRSCCRVLLLMMLALPLIAQEKPKTNEPPGMGAVLNRQLGNLEREFVSAAEAMPEDKFSFAPSTGEFKGVRTFAEQVKHVAASNYVFAAAVLEEKSPLATVGENGPAEMKSKADIIKFLKDSFAYCRKALASVNEKNATLPIKSPFGQGTATRLGIGTLTIGHGWDHYGQMVVYLRMNGIIPPASRP